ncbi:tyrosine-protein phosphatase non-receptor type 18 isoform 1-T1 [Aulostomus maculatus]
MNDTYAIVNKPKHPHRPSANPANSDAAPPRLNTGSSTLPASHYYDNDPAPVYSTVRPRARPNSAPHPPPTIYTTTVPAKSSSGDGPLSPGSTGKYQLVSAECSSADNAYEEFSTPASAVSDACSHDGIGFSSRVEKPKGPRDPPADWS